MSNAEVPMDAAKLTKIYRRIRDAREDLAAEYKKRDQELKDQLRQVELLLLAEIERTGGNGLKNEHGTVSRKISERFWSTDWDSFKRFAIAHNALDLFEQRIAQKNMAAFLAENPGKIPEGLQVDRRYAVHVVKPRSKPE